jgi:hypothetical protein
VELVSQFKRQTDLPDLAIDPNYTIYEGGNVSAVIFNLGCAKAENILVRLKDKVHTIQEKRVSLLEASLDYKPRKVTILFEKVAFTENLYITVDPDNAIDEILKENNSGPVTAGKKEDILCN